MKYNFLESVTEKEFTIEINGSRFKVIRDNHLRKFRKGENKPKDFAMSKSKYQDILSKAFDKIQDGVPTTITWSKDEKNNCISIEKANDIFKVFGCINNSKTDKEQLYAKADVRINL